jgi:hypothetical protein
MTDELALPPGGREALRKALLQRIADRLAFAPAILHGQEARTLYPAPGWECCRVRFDWPTQPPYQYPTHQFAHQLCRGERCCHWHHYDEVILA